MSIIVKRCVICNKTIYVRAHNQKYCAPCARDVQDDQIATANKKRRDELAKAVQEMEEAMMSAKSYHPGGLDLIAAAVLARAYLDGFTSEHYSIKLDATARYQARQWYRENARAIVETLQVDIPLPCLDGGEG